MTETEGADDPAGPRHFALTSGDGWSPELCVVGIPQLVLAQTKRHAMNGKQMDEEGVATFLGDAADVTARPVEGGRRVLLDDPMERKGMTRCARNLFDGRGPDRIVNGMEIMLHAPARHAPRRPCRRRCRSGVNRTHGSSQGRGAGLLRADLSSVRRSRPSTGRVI